MPLTVVQSESIVSATPQYFNFGCANAPLYGDSIIYTAPVKGDYIIFPVNAASLGKGKFLSWPAGLLLDSSSGAINVSGSETGMRYVIGFIKQGSTDTCMSNLLLAGVSYIDSIYVLSNNDTLAVPYYNANAAAPAVCDGSDDSDYPDNAGQGNGNDKCIFDATDKKGNKGQANKKNVKVRTISGMINLKASLSAGAFGSNPADGANIIVPIVYNLNDKSKKATQQINVELMYYTHRSDIPLSVVNQVSQDRTAFYKNLPIFGTPRPPIIIITRFF